jgi:hypothetical protein
MTHTEVPSYADGSRAYALVALAILSFIGCGPSATTVSGTVTLDGEPLPAAALMFYPAAGDGPTSHAFTDATGRFSTKIFPKKTSVTVSLYKPTGEMRDGEPVAEQAVPARYIDRETTVLSIEPVEGKNTVCDFALTTKP